jgi:eukaryotic-like serine/threonine-protein kinase
VPLIDPDRWRHLEPLLDEVLDLPPEARDAYLAALRARAPEDADALASLLDETRTSWLGTTHRARSIGDVVQQLAAPAEGSRLGPWRLERPLGQGGMGTVWLATRADGLFTGQVAVKLLHPSMVAGEAAVLFRREADVLARLTHPAIARLYDAGVTDDGQPYLVLEYVDGQPLDAWCAARRPSQTARLELMRRICDAVTHAHAHGIVHRDLKPGNLFVTADGELKLLDFGIAFLMHESRQERQQPYTPRYAAPEQRDGGTVTTATDVYALGLVLGELLGVPVGTHAQAMAPASTSVAEDLQAIIRRATADDPATRYPTVAALGDELRRFLGHEPVIARRGGAWYRARRFARRHTVGLTAAVAVAAALLTGTMISVQQARAAREQRDLALRSERRARTVSEVMLSLMTELPSVDADVRAVRALQRARRLLDAYLGDDRAERARLAIELARQFSLFSRREEARGLLDDATQDATALGDSVLRAEATCQVSLTGDSRTTTTISVDVDSVRTRLPVDAWRAHATCAMAHSQRLITQMQGDSADAIADSAVRLAQLAGDTVSIFYATLLLDRLQTIGWSKGDFHRKMHEYQRAARGLESIGLALSVPALRVASEAATYSRDIGRLQAADSATEAVRTYLEEGERWRAVTPRLAIDLAMVAHGLARFDDAQRWYERSLQQTSASSNEPIAVRVRQQYARFLGETGDLRGANAQLDTLRTMLARSSNSAFEAARIRTEVVVQAASGDRRRAWTRLDSLVRSRGFPGELRLIEWPDALTEYAHLSYQLRRYDEARVAIARVRERFSRDTVVQNGSLRLASLQLLEARLQLAGGVRDSAEVSARNAERALQVAVGASHPLTHAAGALRDSLAQRVVASSAPPRR